MKQVVYGIDVKRVMRSKLVLGIADGWLSADGNVIYQAKDLKVGLFRGEGLATAGLDAAASAWHYAPRGRARIAGRDADEADHATGRRHRDGDRLIHRQQHAGSAGEPARGEIRRRARRPICRARLPLPGAWRAHADGRRRWSIAGRCASTAAAPPGTTSPWSRRSATPGWKNATSPTNAPASSWARAGPRPARSWRPPTSPAARDRNASDRSRCRRRCARPRRRRSPPGSRSRASTIRSRRPARPRTIASATRWRTIQLGRQDVIFAGGCEELDWTLSVLFDAMGAMSSKFNQTPDQGLACL